MLKTKKYSKNNDVKYTSYEQEPTVQKLQHKIITHNKLCTVVANVSFMLAPAVYFVEQAISKWSLTVQITCLSIMIAWLIIVFGTIGNVLWTADIKRLTLDLSDTQDKAVIGLLIEVYCSGKIRGNTERLIVQNALYRTLGQVTSSDSQLLTRIQQDYLAVWLINIFDDSRVTQYEFFAVAIEALALIGDSTCLKRIEILTKNSAKTKIQHQMKTVLHEHLPIWQERLKAGHVPETLLRPAKNSFLDDELLCPTSGGNGALSEENAQLLIPAINQNKAKPTE